MFGASFFDPFQNDPFFRGHGQQASPMQQMQQMHQNMMQGMMAPMQMMPQGMMGQAALTDGRAQQIAPGNQRSQALAPAQTQFMDPFGSLLGGGLFQNMNSMMSNMHRQMGTAQNDPNGHFYSSSSVMSYSNTGDGRPKVYQAHHSTRQAPGGLREEKRSVRDSEAAMEKMSVGRYLNERGHVVERARHTHSGEMEENQDYINLDEEEGPAFDNEWREKAQRHYREQSHHPRRVTDGRRRYDHPYHDRSYHRQQALHPHRPAAIEYRPGSVEHRPSSTETRPVVIDYRQQAVEPRERE